MTEADEKLLNIIKEKINFKLRDRILVKPLAPIMLDMEIEKPIYKLDEDGKEMVDENGFKIYEDTEKVVENVQSQYSKGIIIKLPDNIDTEAFLGIKEGDTILYPTGSTINFDLIKDSVFLLPFNIVALYD